MNKFLVSLCLTLLISFTVSAQTKKAIMILIDGVPADVQESVNTPIMDEIASVGGYTRAHVGGGKGEYTETPTISAPGYMNMITGVWGYKHNVWGNSVKDPNYNYWSVFRIVKDANPQLKTAIFSTWEDNRTKLVGEGKPAAGNFKFDHSYDGFELDEKKFPHTDDRKFMFDIDEVVSTGAADFIRSDAPDLSWVYLEFTDDMGHMYGDSPQMIEAVKGADNQIGRIWEAIKYREAKFNEEWMIVITTDHGRSTKDGKGHGGQSDRERTTWMVTNQADLNARFHENPPVVDVTPSILQHMEIVPNEGIRSEMDGISFVGDISLMDAKSEFNNGQLSVTWEAVNKEGSVEIYQSTTNSFAKGGKDQYSLLGKAEVKDGKFKTSVSLPKGKTKILLKAQHNWTNTWVIVE